jgi:hypothetical protein
MKKYINTQSFFAAAAFSAVLFTASCKKDFLNVPPQAQQPSVTFWKTPEDALKGVNAIYANLRSWNNVAFNAIAIESTGSDEADKGSTPTDATFFNLYDQFTVTSTHGTLLDFWTGQYQNINLISVWMRALETDILQRPNLLGHILISDWFVPMAMWY